MASNQVLSVAQTSSPVKKRVPPLATAQPTESPLADMFTPMEASKQQNGDCQRRYAH
jgi:hypothetical protein